MWIRIACPNGHALNHAELRYAARSGLCPQCRAIVSMWIKVKCPKGHELKVRTRFGGKTGKCPECASPVTIPELNEEAIVAMLGKAAKATAVVGGGEDVLDTPHEPGSTGSSVLKRMPKTCPNCKKQVSHKFSICPHCRTYMPIDIVGEAVERAGNAQSLSCQNCGVTSFPGATVCNNCGVPLVE